MDKFEIAKELLKNTTNYYLKEFIEEYIETINFKEDSKRVEEVKP